ncbi:replication initiation protein [Jeotgalibaca dankookensis]|uniref:replication initiation protein n=1 Tax=Jeotgalibaca dankookensis TaxID=708126 RepID=UPI0009E53CCB|nr:replication initiation protein [Jeotgalibaca dankookensis]
MNEVVKYHNDLNSVSFRTWSSEEMNLFFTVIAKIRNKGIETIILETDELKELAQFADKHHKRWEEVMIKAGKKVMNLKYYETSGRSFSIMNLFQEFTVDPDKQVIIVSATTRFEYIINRIQANFTSYELKEFVNLQSTYSKTAYRLLKQWRTIGKKEFQIENFKRMMDMPEYYTPSHIDRLVLKPIMKELPQFFKGLKVKKVKSNKRGNPVLAYEFTWIPEHAEKWVEGKFEKKDNQKITRKETLPDWAQDGYVAPKSSPVSKELQAKYEQRLARIRNNKKD